MHTPLIARTDIPERDDDRWLIPIYAGGQVAYYARAFTLGEATTLASDAVKACNGYEQLLAFAKNRRETLEHLADQFTEAKLALEDRAELQTARTILKSVKDSAHVAVAKKIA